MFLKNVVLSIAFIVISMNTWSLEFIASKDIKLILPDTPIVAHSGDSIIFKYPNWVVRHQILNPKTFYQGVDLTGIFQAYIRNIFEPGGGDLAAWMLEMAKEQAKTFKVTKKNMSKSMHTDFTLYSVFDSEGRNGHIFLVGKDYVSHFNLISTEKEYLEFLEILKGSL